MNTGNQPFPQHGSGFQFNQSHLQEQLKMNFTLPNQNPPQHRMSLGTPMQPNVTIPIHPPPQHNGNQMQQYKTNPQPIQQGSKKQTDDQFLLTAKSGPSMNGTKVTALPQEDANQTAETVSENNPTSNGADKIPSITEAYESTVRPIIDVIDSLRRMGLDHDVSLPTITVIGDQSSGKSSVLEAISGVQLPRGKGIVTRCPIELRLRHVKEPGIWKASLTYQSGGETKEKVLSNKVGIEDTIREAQEDLAGARGISKELISLTVESSDVPDLTLVDLPGIARVAVADQDKNIPEKIKALIQDQIQGKSAIILVVVPANVDIATTEALKWATEFDPKGDRTLGVITKPDLVDKGTEQTVLDVLNNILYPLKKGYTIVKCRGQKEIDNNLSLTEALLEENDFFDYHDKYSEIPEEQRGTRTLAIKLSEELKSHIRTCLPKLKEEIRDKKELTEEKLRGMSLAIPDSEDERRQHFLKIIYEYLEDLNSAIHILNSSLSKEYQLFGPARADFVDFMNDLKKISPKDSVLLKYADDTAFREQIEKNIDKYRGREFPTFPTYNAFEETMKNQVKLCKKPTLECLKKAYKRVNQVTTMLVTKHFSRFPRLSTHIQKVIQRVEDDRKQICEEKLEEHIDVESIIFSQDSTYLDEMETTKEEFKQQDEEVATIVTGFGFGVASNASFGGPKPRVNGVPSQTPMKKDGLTLRVDDMYKMMYSYMQIFRKRISDTVPMIIIYNLLDKMYEDVKKELHLLIDKSKVVEMLQENKTIQKQRKQLKNKLDRLTKAEEQLYEIDMDD